jgi:hypothetical protein
MLKNKQNTEFRNKQNSKIPKYYPSSYDGKRDSRRKMSDIYIRDARAKKYMYRCSVTTDIHISLDI